MKSLRFDVEPFRIATTFVEPGFFRTELLEKSSTTWARHLHRRLRRTDRRDEDRLATDEGHPARDPARLASALITVLDRPTPPRRWIAGADAVRAVEQKARELLDQADAERALPTSLAHE